MFLERGHNRAKKRPPTTITTLFELKETRNHQVLRPVNGLKKSTGGTGTRRRARACLERNGAAFGERLDVGLVTVGTLPNSSTVI